MIDEEGGFDIAANGQIDFDNFDEIEIEPGSTQLFLVTVDIVDGTTVIGRTITAEVQDIEADDEDNDDLEVLGVDMED